MCVCVCVCIFISNPLRVGTKRIWKGLVPLRHAVPFPFAGRVASRVPGVDHIGMADSGGRGAVRADLLPRLLQDNAARTPR